MSDGESLDGYTYSETEEEEPQQPAAASEPARKQAPQQGAGWSNMPAATPEGNRQRCDYVMYRGRQAGKPCPRNGLHPKDGKMYCTNHGRLMGRRTEKLNQPPPPRKRKEPEQPSQPASDVSDREEEELDSGSVQEPAPVPVQQPKVLGFEKEEPQEKKHKGMNSIERRRMEKYLKIQAKEKYKRKYAKKPKPTTVWDAHTYKSARNNLNGMMDRGGGTSSLFYLPKE